jgi:hypothetical protein
MHALTPKGGSLTDFPATGLERWDWSGQSAVPEASLRAVMEHPAFARAQRHAIEGALAFAGRNPAFQSMMLDTGGFFLCFVTLYMHATTGITHRHLRELAGGGMLSAGRATALLWRLRHGRFVEQGADKSYRPTQILREGMRGRMRIEFEAMLPLEPGVRVILDRFDEDPMFDGFVRAMVSVMMEDVRRPAVIPRLEAFDRIGARAAGILTIYALVAALPEQPIYPPSGVAPVSVSGLARRFGVSRRQVLRLLREMEAAGFVAAAGEGWEVLPELGEVLRLFQAAAFVQLLRAGHRALAKFEIS